MRTLIASSLVTLGLAATGTFNYKENGADWEDACEKGDYQSPIDLPSKYSAPNGEVTTQAAHMSISFDYNSIENKEIKAVMKGDMAAAYQIDLPSGGIMKSVNWLGEQNNYQLLQVHHHTPSEHRYNGKQRDLELHFVHLGWNGKKYTADELAVFSISYEESSTEDEFLANFITGETVNLDTPFSYAQFDKYMDEAAEENFWQYSGSLTTPGCNEIVHWHVSQKARKATKKQINAFRRMAQVEKNGKWVNNDEYYIDGNARVEMEVNYRNIYMKEGPKSFAASVTVGAAALLASVASFF